MPSPSPAARVALRKLSSHVHHIDANSELFAVVEELTAPSWLSLTSRPTSVSALLVLVHFDVLTNSLADANGGIDDIVEAQRPFALKHGVSFGDL